MNLLDPFGLLTSVLPVPPVPTTDPSVVVVTGATSGIGEATALRAAAAGHHLVLVARREPELEKTASACDDEGAASTLVVPTDLADDAAVAAMVAQVVERHDRIDAVLHCAGVVSYGRTEDTTAEDFADVVTTNLLGTACVARHVLPVLRRQRRGDLVVVGSLLGYIAVPEMTPYVVSKWGVRALVRQLRIENVDLPDVRISHVSPGSVDTPIYDNALDSAGAVNTPPPPSISPERVARVVLAQVGSRRAGRQTALSNYALLAAFNLAPAAVYDRVVGPLFHVASRRLRPDATAEAGASDREGAA
ncbi:Sepiapterin reductase [Nocardioides dokdonensis FR1436]|uniref:Sepiapterin reductase n=1 Tax=Nocardioides dokdonensis FR1436 TaxID=1300347 RepID=A0A1A9GJU4_9ACTN|nr:SDR family NAD(P)-dependent oxidoreductase [Nocardioides dokdonensis]ANH37883.1 Sepiapterin reductase [Nocardioides dokdonensis FR1436]